ncbi:DUF2188 domain-containing protein [Rhodococcus sp. LW-XY12]|uniref:DUF2188 domain-containing protein n=1 Tax=Rhodococcus sp. LW-XY12 TaxID=2856851 RepID=UPI001C575CF6|nr:DUF2188 domain-containing protein [Rhodococcus sp. LW-XY12]QXU51860.1 DUF2188 domain-containing protein [Rhodococcus sp. LW-XY12]
MPAGDVETFHQDGSWHNRIEGSSDLLGTYPTREEARRRKVEHLVHNLDGTIGERNTYGHDPRDIPG